ncbi:MAG: 2OG-Fe(II) oxygenase family protein [Actinomycetota bacterium]
MSAEFAVPTIDVSAWTGGDGVARDAIAGAVDDAARTVGFMQIVGHGIPASVLDGVTGAMDEFFAQPLDDKLALVPSRSSINRGYTGTRSERLSYSLGVDSPADLFEAFNVGASRDDFPELDLEGDDYARNLWPSAEAVPSFRLGVEAWFAEAQAFAHRMTSIFARALGVDGDFFERSTDHSIDVLRMVNYGLEPGTEIEPGQLGMGAHTDYGIVTVLWADPVPGLQVLDHGGGWHDVTPAPGALLINLGDLLARWTNDRYVSTMHRVVPPVDTDGRSLRRRSAAFFHDGNADAVISTIESCRDAAGRTAYEDVTVAEHLVQKLRGSRGLELNRHATAEAARITGSAS